MENDPLAENGLRGSPSEVVFQRRDSPAAHVTDARGVAGESADGGSHAANGAALRKRPREHAQQPPPKPEQPQSAEMAPLLEFLQRAAASLRRARVCRQQMEIELRARVSEAHFKSAMARLRQLYAERCKQLPEAETYTSVVFQGPHAHGLRVAIPADSTAPKTERKHVLFVARGLVCNGRVRGCVSTESPVDPLSKESSTAVFSAQLLHKQIHSTTAANPAKPTAVHCARPVQIACNPAAVAATRRGPAFASATLSSLAAMRALWVQHASEWWWFDVTLDRTEANVANVVMANMPFTDVAHGAHVPFAAMLLRQPVTARENRNESESSEALARVITRTKFLLAEDNLHVHLSHVRTFKAGTPSKVSWEIETEVRDPNEATARALHRVWTTLLLPVT